MSVILERKLNKKYKGFTKIADGGWGQIYSAEDRRGGMVAIKMVKLESPQHHSRFQHEVQIHQSVKHRHICKVRKHKIFQSNGKTYGVMMMEKMDIDLLDYQIEQSGLSEDFIKFIFKKVCKCVKYLHSVGVAHLDLKPENILIRIMENSNSPSSPRASRRSMLSTCSSAADNVEGNDNNEIIIDGNGENGGNGGGSGGEGGGSDNHHHQSEYHINIPPRPIQTMKNDKPKSHNHHHHYAHNHHIHFPLTDDNQINFNNTPRCRINTHPIPKFQPNSSSSPSSSTPSSPSPSSPFGPTPLSISIPHDVVLAKYKLRVKICDFEYSKRWDVEKNPTSAYLMDSDSSAIGTREYLAPEVVGQFSSRVVYLMKVDIYSLGAMLYSMITGTFPNVYSPGGRLVQKNKPSKVSRFSRNIHCYNLVSKMMNETAELRPSIDDVLAHPWFRS